MTGQQFYEFLYDWVAGVVAPVKVFRMYQNAEKLAMPYVGIEDDQSWKPFGRPTHYADSLQSITHDYTVTPVFWDIGGFGDSLRLLQESLALRSVRSQFETAGIGILSVGSVSSLPWLSPETEYIRQHRLDVHLSIAHGVLDPSIVPIETVTFINNIGEDA